MYCRIVLQKTNYREIPYRVLDHTWYDRIVDIHKRYAEVKGLTDIFPLFFEEINAPHSEILGYFDHNDHLQAFSLIYKYPSVNCCLADQFAWTYEEPKLKLGYKSLRSECARYKRLGFDYLYLGEVAHYKAQLQGFEVI